jgi:hypothetical protein
MHKSAIPDEAASDADDSLRIKHAVGKSSPPKAPSFTPILQESAKPGVDKSLDPPKGLTGIDMPVVIRPSSDILIYLFQESLLGYRCPPIGQVFDPMAQSLFRFLPGKDVNTLLSRGRALSLNELKPQKVETFCEFRHLRLFFIQR